MMDYLQYPRWKGKRATQPQAIKTCRSLATYPIEPGAYLANRVAESQSARRKHWDLPF